MAAQRPLLTLKACALLGVAANGALRPHMHESDPVGAQAIFDATFSCRPELARLWAWAASLSSNHSEMAALRALAGFPSTDTWASRAPERATARREFAAAMGAQSAAIPALDGSDIVDSVLECAHIGHHKKFDEAFWRGGPAELLSIVDLHAAHVLGRPSAWRDALPLTCARCAAKLGEAAAPPGALTALECAIVHVMEDHPDEPDPEHSPRSPLFYPPSPAPPVLCPPYAPYAPPSPPFGGPPGPEYHPAETLHPLAPRR